MDDCQHRTYGEDFCRDCPLRPVRDRCERAGFIVRPSMMPASFHTRVGVFILSALAITLTPLVGRLVQKTAEENLWPEPLITFLTAGIGVATVVTLASAFYGIYASIFAGKGWPPKPTETA